MKSRVLGLSLVAFLSMTATSMAQVGPDQSVSNFGQVVSVPTLVSTGVVGVGNSISGSAAGALAQISVSYGSVLPVTAAGVQSATNFGAVANFGEATLTNLMLGVGNTMSLSATGAATAVSITSLDSITSDALIGGPGSSQSALNVAAPIVNQGLALLSGPLAGFGNSIAVTAVGAVAQMSISAVNGDVAIAQILASPQSAINSGSVSNTGLAVAGPVVGMANSISVSATGAAASAGVTTLNGAIGTADVAVSQTVINGGSVINQGDVIVNGLTGLANSASVSATGALAQGSVTTVNGGLVAFAGVSGSQLVVNTGAVTNSGSIVNGGGIAGSGNSLSVSAVGAAAVASLTHIR